MDDAFLVVVIVVPLIAFALAIVALATSGGSYDRIGRGGLSLDDPPPAASPAEREADLRDLLDARNARRVAHGEAPADVDAELRELRVASDPELEAEVRQLVEARNARRAARGQPPLDVEAEVSRRLREL